MPTKPTIAAVLIVKDEAHHLAACLTALRRLVDAIVVVDTGSRDDSPRIAADYGAVVGHFPWTGRFDEARNRALELAAECGPFDYVLSVDADERVRGPLEWRADLDPTRHAGATVEFVGREGHAPYREYRLFALRPDLRWRHRIHETVLADLHRIQRTEGLTLVEVPLRFEHLGYRVDAKARKYARDLALLQDAASEQPTRAYLRTELARIHEVLGQDDEAEAAWREALALVRDELYAGQLLRGDGSAEADREGGHDSVQIGAYAGLLMHLQTRHHVVPEEELPVLEEALAFFPGSDLIRFIHMVHLGASGALEEALALGAAMRAAPGDRRGVLLSLFEVDLPHRCAEYAAALGRLDLALSLEPSLTHRRRLDRLAELGDLAAHPEPVALHPELELTARDERTLALRLHEDRVLVGGPSAFVVASLTEPTSPAALTAALAEASGAPREEAAALVARALRRFIYRGHATLGADLAPVRVQLAATSAARVLLFELPALAHRARRRVLDVVDVARRRNLVPLLWRRPHGAPSFDPATVVEGLPEVERPWASRWLAEATEVLVLPADAPVPRAPLPSLGAADVRLWPDVPLPREEGYAVSPATASAVQLRGASGRGLDVASIDALVEHVLAPERRLRWASTPPAEATVVADEPGELAPGRRLCVIPHFRCDRWLGRALHGVVTQTAPLDHVVVLCDGGETVDERIREEFPTVTFALCPERVGPFALAQAAIDATDHAWIMFHDADDWSACDRLARSLAAARRHGARFVATDVLQVHERDGSVSPAAYGADATAAARAGRHAAVHGSSIVHRSVLEATGGLATGLRFGADLELASRLAWQTCLRVVPGASLFYQLRSSSLTRSLDTGLHSAPRRALHEEIRRAASARAEASVHGQAVDLRPLRTRPPIELHHLGGPHLIPSSRRRTR